LKTFWKKIGKNILSVSILILLILILSPIIALLLKLVFGIAVKE
jgi:hypothetical protein